VLSVEEKGGPAVFGIRLRLRLRMRRNEDRG